MNTMTTTFKGGEDAVTPEMMEELVIFLLYMTGLNAVFLVRCLVADYIFPHIPFIERFLESLPEWDDEEAW